MTKMIKRPKEKLYLDYKYSLIRFVNTMISDIISKGITDSLVFVDLDAHADLGEMPETDCLTISGVSATFDEEVTTISGLSHLAGKDVVALSNGGVIENLKVTQEGKVELPIPVKEITIGLPFTFELETLNIEGENTQGLKKIINNICINISKSREEFFIGGSEGLYVETDRSLESVNNSNLLFSCNVSATPLNSATANATIIVMQRRPLPLTILSLSATFSLEDISDTQ